MLTITDAVHKLEEFHGRQPRPVPGNPFEMILWEMCAELASDEKRGRAFAALQTRIGTHPADILKARATVLLEVARLGGMVPEQRARRIREAAALAMELYEGDLSPILKLPMAEAKKALRKFPSVGEPGAEKILLLTRSQRVLALESNGLRVLRRLGYGAGDERTNWAATYRSVQRDLAGRLPADFDTLIAAHQLLRLHGKEVCKTGRPLCGQCPLREECPAGGGA